MALASRLAGTVSAVALLVAIGMTACGDSTSGGLKFSRTQDGGLTPGTGGSVSPGGDASDGSGGDVGNGGAGAGGKNPGGASGAGGAGNSGGADGGTCKNSLDCGALVCDPTSHLCVECATVADCAPGASCVANRCRTQTACTSDKQCTPLGQLCDTSLGQCVDCVKDADCAAAKPRCVQGICATEKCVPNSLFCNGNVVEQCDDAGQTSSAYTTCGAGEYCDTPTSSCKPRVCTPNAPACDGTRATTCNAAGSGYAAGGQECAPALSCAAGQCVNCSGGAGGSQKLVRMTEVMIGTPEYIVLENRGTCPVDLAGMTLSFDTSYVSGVPFTYTLPTHVLAPGAKVFVLDETATPQGDDILANGNIDWQGAYGGTVLLCAGSCATVTNVVDVLAYFGGQAPPALPAPVTFTPALTQITTTNEQTTSFVRVGYAGAYPAFKASDWSTGTATREGNNGTTCPTTQPPPSTFCTGFGLSCPYGTVTCSCSFTTFYWECL